MERKTINIFDVVGGKAAVSTEDGDGLFKTINAFLEKDLEVVLDFVNIETLTSTFLNAAVGQLYSKFESPFLRDHLSVSNLQPEDKELMIKIIERAKEYFKDKDNFERDIREAWMTNSVMDVESYVPQDGDRYFFDANIWLYLYCPIGDYNKNIIRKYDGFLKKAINNDTTIYFSSLIVSEIVNRWLRLDFQILKRRYTNMKHFKNNYRGSDYYNSAVKDIERVFNRQLLTISTPLEDRAKEISMRDVISELDKIDFNDCYYHHLAKLENLIIVTHDADFAAMDTGISILTANQTLLNIN